MYDLRTQVFAKLHRLQLGYFDRTPSGRILTRATSDVGVLYELFGEGVINIFSDLVLLLGILVVWFYMDWRLAIMLSATGPLLALVSYNFRVRARTAYRSVRVRIAALTAFLAETIGGMRTVQAFRREQASVRRYDHLNAEHRDAQIETVRQFARFFPLVEGITFLAILSLLAYGGWQEFHVRGTGGIALTAGAYNLYIQYIRRFFMPIQSLAERYNIFQAAMAASERLFQLLDEPETVRDPESPLSAAPLCESVELRNVWFAYAAPAEDKWILKDVSLRIEKGQTVALVGATGAGKSTVINLVTRLYDVQRGAVLYDGRDVREYSQSALRSRMAIVLQDVFLFSGTIADNIRLGNTAITDAQVEQAARYVNAHTFIERLPQGYQSEVLERGATLSTGQKQLLAFARAIAFNPDLLILDEATSNIDTETEMLIQDALARIMRDRTCIVVAHRLSTIQNSSQIVVFSHGRIHEQGTHQELLRREGLYRKLYELQYKV
jgi:ABC-type multidrug transport system fused ATPase/permease subunit